MAAENNKKFTERMLQDEGKAKRLSEIQNKIQRERDEAEDLKAKLDLVQYESTLPGGQQAGAEGSLGIAMLLALEKQFYHAAEIGDAVSVFAYILAGYDVNKPRRKTNDTVLHIAATRNARDVIRVLIETEKCDYLLRDAKGLLPSEMAYLYGHNPALARLLGIKEREQAERDGIKLTRRQ